jgi:hypothetical protein
MQKHFTLIGFAAGVLLLFVAAWFYPGGSVIDPASVGYNWKTNYISHLLNPVAVNGTENLAQPWAVLGVFFVSAGFGWFFIRFSEDIGIKSAANVVKYAGILATIGAFLAVIPSLHDPMVMFTSVLTLLIFFYFTVLAYKVRLFGLALASTLFLATFYYTTFMFYGSYQLEYLPIMQKVIFLLKIGWVLWLQYGVDKTAFRTLTA